MGSKPHILKSSTLKMLLKCKINPRLDFIFYRILQSDVVKNEEFNKFRSVSKTLGSGASYVNNRLNTVNKIAPI